MLLRKDLTQTKLAAQHSVDEQAEAVRASIITLGAGQAMAYQQKLKEAEAYLANTAIALGEIPHIVREAEAEQTTLLAMASMIVISAYEWTVMSSRIEKLRIGHKRQIADATTPAQIAALQIIDWSQINV